MDIHDMRLCANCIEAIRSHGEKLFVSWENVNTGDEPLACEWCGEDDDDLELFECIFDD